MKWAGFRRIGRACKCTLMTFVVASASRGYTQQAPAPAKPAAQSGSSAASSPAPSPASGAPQFFDPPKFTVSGVTDTTNLGGHGSDTVVRTRESLAKATATLGETPEPTREAAERARDRVQLLISKSPGRADLHHQLAIADEALGDSLASVREYQRAAELDSSETYLFDWGAELLLHHAPEPALEVFTKGNRLFPKSERMLLGMGAAHYALGSIDESLANVRAASDLNPGDVSPYLFIGEMNRAEKVPSAAAVEIMRRFVGVHPESSEANYEYAVALWKSRRTTQDESPSTSLAAQEEALLNTAIQISPKFAAVYLQMGIVQSDRKEFEKAIGAYQQAITVADQSEAAGSSTGAESPDTDSVIQEAHFRLGTAYRQIGDLEKSKMEMKICSDLAAKSAHKTERERHQVQQFVYTLRDQPPAER